jgi:hydroxymethylpyrimidine pyrophosphatase-like HAD family hydrolase
MIKTPGRKPQSPVPSSFRKNQLSSDAKIIITLIKKQPQTKEEICKETKISDRTFYRIISLLEEKKIVKCEDHTYALWYFNPLEKQIEDTFSKLLIQNEIVHPDHIVNEIGRPWHEIEVATRKIAKKLGLTPLNNNGQITFVKM